MEKHLNKRRIIRLDFVSQDLWQVNQVWLHGVGSVSCTGLPVPALGLTPPPPPLNPGSAAWCRELA